jgi:hypothetical protein
VVVWRQQQPRDVLNAFNVLSAGCKAFHSTQVCTPAGAAIVRAQAESHFEQTCCEVSFDIDQLAVPG